MRRVHGEETKDPIILDRVVKEQSPLYIPLTLPPFSYYSEADGDPPRSRESTEQKLAAYKASWSARIVANSLPLNRDEKRKHDGCLSAMGGLDLERLRPRDLHKLTLQPYYVRS